MNLTIRSPDKLRMYTEPRKESCCGEPVTTNALQNKKRVQLQNKKMIVHTCINGAHENALVEYTARIKDACITLLYQKGKIKN